MQAAITALLEKYTNGTATPEEISLVESWYLNYRTPEGGLRHDQLELEYQMGLADLSRRINKAPARLWPRIAAAASVILCLSSGGYFLQHQTRPAALTVQVHSQDIAPGGNKAVLTLANGSRIILTGAKDGLLAQQGNTAIAKTADGQLVYKPSNTAKAAGMQYNTMATPRGGQYRLTLSDGTKVWLNAASSITYPAQFTGNERKVKISGEAYFEVVHNAKRPFKVEAGSQLVEDIGTHFNINSYADEPAAKTTLLEGSVRVSLGRSSAVLRPGEAAVLSAGHVAVTEGDSEATAWREGKLVFHDEGLPAIMRRVARAYDVQVAYRADVSGMRFGGAVTTTKKISSILDYFRKTASGLDFRLEGRTVTVINKNN